MSDKAGAAVPWDVPAIDAADGSGLLTAANLESVQKEAYDEAFAKGHADGVAAGEAAVAERVRRLDELLNAFAKPFEQLDERVEKQLVELAMVVVKQLFRREIRIDPTHVIGVVREAIQLLPGTSTGVRLHLNPDDAALVRESLAPADGDPAWSIVEDPLVSRGGCRVTTENSQVDATAEARLEAAISAVMGDERRDD